MCAQRKLLITGVSGFIGSKVLLDALNAGWEVRITARTAGRLQHVLQNAFFRPFADQIESLLIPDVLEESAYRQALVGITHVIHTATPLPFPTKNPIRDIIDPAVKGTMTLLNEALETPSLQRIVITSSLVSNMPYPPPQTAITPTTRVPDPTASELSSELDLFTAYRYSKIMSLNLVDRFRRDRRPQFDVVNVIPGFVHGANLLATRESVLTGSNGLLLATLLGQHLPAPRLAGAAHIDDVAQVHLHALSEEVVPRGSTIDLAISRSVVYDEAWPIVQSAFAEAVKLGTLKQGGQASLPVNYDVSDTLQRCGIQHMKTYQQMVEDAVGQYLQLQK